MAEPSTHAELSALLDSGNLLSGADPEPPFWEALGSLRSGRDSRARLALAVKEAGFLRKISTHALLRLELGLAGVGQGKPAALSDAASCLGVTWQLATDTRLSLNAYPFDTDYVRVGYLHALDWGGTQSARRESIFLAREPSAPGFLLGLESRRIRLFSGLKWAKSNAELSGSQRLWGALGGGSFAISPQFRVDMSFGFFQRESGFVEGASARWVWQRDVAEPEVASEPFRPAPLRDDPERLAADAPRGWALALEGVVLVVRPEQPATAGEWTLVAAPGAALYASVRERLWGAHLALTWRSLPFVFRNDARFSADQATLSAAGQQAELTAWLGGSFTPAALPLVPSLEVGARLPGALLTPSSLPGVAMTWIAGGVAGLEPLPLGAARLPLLATRLALRFSISSTLSLSAAGDYQRDPNRTRVATSGSVARRAFAPADALTVVGGVQARW